MTPTPHRLNAFAYVYETGSVNEAAAALGMRAPAVSEQIAKLSSDHAVTLFVRDNNRLEPTPLAHRIYPHAVAIRDAEHSAHRILSDFQTQQTGRIRIGIGNAQPGMSVVQKLRQMIPKVTVHIETGSWDRIMRLFERDQIDIGLLPDVPPTAGVTRSVCFEQHIVAVMHNNHPLARSKEVSISQLVTEPLIFGTKDSSTQRLLDRVLGQMDTPPVPLVVSDSLEGVLEAVSQNIGIGFVWRTTASRISELMYLPVTELSAPVPEHIFARSDSSNKLVPLIMSVAANSTFDV